MNLKEFQNRLIIIMVFENTMSHQRKTKDSYIVTISMHSTKTQVFKSSSFLIEKLNHSFVVIEMDIANVKSCIAFT